MDLNISTSKKIIFLVCSVAINVFLNWILNILNVPLEYILPANFLILSNGLLLGQVFGLLSGILSSSITILLLYSNNFNPIFIAIIAQCAVYGFLVVSIYNHRKEMYSSIGGALIFGTITYVLIYFFIIKFLPTFTYESTGQIFLTILKGIPSFALQIFLVPKIVDVLKNKLAT